MRESWAEFWLDEAQHWATRSTCPARSVGAVLVRNKRILATGYNGVSRGVPHPATCRRRELGIPSGEQPHLCGCQHAEANAVANAAAEGVSIAGATAYLTCAPCRTCLGQLANAGVVKVVYRGPYPDVAVERLADEAGMELEEIEPCNLT